MAPSKDAPNQRLKIEMHFMACPGFRKVGSTKNVTPFGKGTTRIGKSPSMESCDFTREPKSDRDADAAQFLTLLDLWTDPNLAGLVVLLFPCVLQRFGGCPK